MRLLRPLLRFFAWWAGLFALLAGGSVCPCCGSPTCTGGATGAGLLSGLFAILSYLPRWLWRLLAVVARRRDDAAEAQTVESDSGLMRTNRK